MSGGVEPPAQTQRELNWCMLEGLLEATTPTEVVVLTISVSLKNQRTLISVLDASFMYGAEYEMWGNVPSANLQLHEHDVPCVVCYICCYL